MTGTDFDNTQALREGWGLFDANGVLEIQRVDEWDLPEWISDGTPSFESDDGAVLHVQAAAQGGSGYHQRALSLNGTPPSSHVDFDGDGDGDGSEDAKAQTNVEFVSDLMNFSCYGALSQMFVINAIMKHAERVASADPASFDHPMLNGAAWVGVAKEIAGKCAAKYGPAKTEKPAG